MVIGYCHDYLDFVAVIDGYTFGVEVQRYYSLDTIDIDTDLMISGGDAAADTVVDAVVAVDSGDGFGGGAVLMAVAHSAVSRVSHASHYSLYDVFHLVQLLQSNGFVLVLKIIEKYSIISECTLCTY